MCCSNLYSCLPWENFWQECYACGPQGPHYTALLVVPGLLVLQMYVEEKPLAALAIELEVPVITTPLILLGVMSLDRRDLHVVEAPDVMAVLIVAEPVVSILHVLIVPVHEPVLVTRKGQGAIVLLVIVVALVVLFRITPLVLLIVHGDTVAVVPLMILEIVALLRVHLISALASLMLQVFLGIPVMMTVHILWVHTYVHLGVLLGVRILTSILAELMVSEVRTLLALL